MAHMYDTNLDKNDANFTPLSPLSFLIRAAEVIQIELQSYMAKNNLHGLKHIKEANNLRAHFLKEV